MLAFLLVFLGKSRLILLLGCLKIFLHLNLFTISFHNLLFLQYMIYLRLLSVNINYKDFQIARIADRPIQNNITCKMYQLLGDFEPIRKLFNHKKNETMVNCKEYIYFIELLVSFLLMLTFSFI